MLLSSFLSLASSFLLASASLPAIVRDGTYLFDSSSGDRFYVKGVAYASNYGSSQTPVAEGTISAVDPLANSAGCTRDIPYFQQLGINLIRVYQVNSSLDHSSCMSALSSAGIYVLLDLATPADNGAISSTDPEWNVALMTNFIETIDAFGSYDNVFGFNIGNEVISSQENDEAAPYIKAAVRDIKSYLTAHNYSQLLGYTATDSPNSRAILPYYLACNSTETSIDYWGLNIYEWCGNSSFTTSGYQARTEELQDLGVPAFFSEYGCNAVEPRDFSDVPVLYSYDMTGVWSGGIIYEYIQQSNDYGLVNVSADGSSVTTLQDFDNLKTQYSSISPPSLSKSSYSANITSPPSCPSYNSSWTASDAIPPTPNDNVCNCVVSQLSCLSTYNEDTSASEIGTAIGTVCGLSSDACTSISGNGTYGTYGALSYCDPLQQLNIAIDTYFELQNRADSACDFSGLATLSTSGKPTATSAVASATSSCLAAGFASGTGIPSASATPSGATTRPIVSSTSTSGSGSKKSAAFTQAPMSSTLAIMVLGSTVVAALSGLTVLL